MARFPSPSCNVAPLPRTPLFQVSAASTLRHRALLIGINYASPSNNNEQGYRPLKSPINDAKGVKKALIGEVQIAALILTRSTRLLSELFNYKGENIKL